MCGIVDVDLDDAWWLSAMLMLKYSRREGCCGALEAAPPRHDDFISRRLSIRGSILDCDISASTRSASNSETMHGEWDEWKALLKGSRRRHQVTDGSALAITISYSANHSIPWAIIHGILNWLYIVYFALFHG
jgi:hypothetical protein